MMNSGAWILIIAGLMLASIGVLWLVAPSIPWLGRLPGDVVIERPNLRVYIPLTTCILLSLLLTGVAWLVRYFSR